MFAWFCLLASCAAAGHVMTGRPRDVPADSSQVLAAARFAVLEYDRANGDTCGYKIVNITSARIQVVAGINYILEVQLGRTTRQTSPPCVYRSGPEVMRCHFVVTEVPWEDSSVLSQKKCH